MKTCVRTVDLPVPIESVWSVLSSFDDLARWVPEVDHSSLLHHPPGSVGVGVGAVRRVQVGRSTVLETVTAWSPPEHLAYDITGLPAVLRRVGNDWRLRAGRHGTTVRLTTTVDAGPRPPQQVVAGLVARRLGRTSDSMLRGLARHLDVVAVGQGPRDARTRTRPGVAS